MPASPAAARIVRNTMANGAGAAMAMAIGLVLTPFIIDRLGIAAFGVWSLALTLTFAAGYASLADAGVERATVRFVAEAQTTGDLDLLNETVSTALAFFLVVGAALAPILVVASGPLTDLFGVPADLAGSAQACFALVGVQLIFEFPARALIAALEGAQDYVSYQVIELSRLAIQAVASVAILLSGGGLGGLALALLVSAAFAFLAFFVQAHRRIPGLRVRPWNASWSRVRAMRGLAGQFFTLRLSSMVFRQMDQLILGIASGPAAVGLYAIANRIYAGVGAISTVSVSALVPAAASLRENRAVLQDLYLRGSSYATAITMSVSVAALILAEPLLRTWIGPDAVPAVNVTRLMLMYAILQSVQDVGSMMVFGTGNLRLPILLSLGSVALNLVISVALVKPFGPSGVVLGTLLGMGAAWPFLLRFYLREYDSTLHQWWSRIVKPNLPGVAAQLVIAFPVLHLAQQTNSLLLVGSLFALLSGVSVAAFYAFGLDVGGRRALRHTLRGGLSVAEGT